MVCSGRLSNADALKADLRRFAPNGFGLSSENACHDQCQRGQHKEYLCSLSLHCQPPKQLIYHDSALIKIDLT
jgi:hypothetical protein